MATSVRDDAGVGRLLRGINNNADAVAVGTVANMSADVTFGYGFNGTTWDRIRVQAANADALVAPTIGLLSVANYGYVLNAGGSYDRIRSVAVNDAMTQLALGVQAVVPYNMGFNGVNWDRLRTQSITNIVAASKAGVLTADAPTDWTESHVPNAGLIATCTHAGVAGARHIVTGIYAQLEFTAIPPATTTLVLRDGASGIGAILWQLRLSNAASPAGSSRTIAIPGLHIPSGANGSAMTLEFTLFSGATNFQSVSMTGYSVP